MTLFALVGLNACKNDKASSKISVSEKTERELAADISGEYPEVELEEALFDFGTIEEGEVVEHVFHFTNTGTQPLKISQAKASCGCTVSEWTKEEVAPSEKGKVAVKFDSKGRPGLQNKSVRLITNTKNGNETVRFTVNVE